MCGQSVGRFCRQIPVRHENLGEIKNIEFGLFVGLADEIDGWCIPIWLECVGRGSAGTILRANR